MSFKGKRKDALFDIEGENSIMSDKKLGLFNIKHSPVCCNVIWLVKINVDSLNISVTDDMLLKYYLKKKYYIHDEIMNFNQVKNIPEISLGTSQGFLSKNNAFYDLHTKFNITEILSVKKQVEQDIYVVRFFTAENRFVFMGNIIKWKTLLDNFVGKIIELDKKVRNDIILP